MIVGQNQRELSALVTTFLLLIGLIFLVTAAPVLWIPHFVPTVRDIGPSFPRFLTVSLGTGFVAYLACAGLLLERAWRMRTSVSLLLAHGLIFLAFMMLFLMLSLPGTIHVGTMWSAQLATGAWIFTAQHVVPAILLLIYSIYAGQHVHLLPEEHKGRWLLFGVATSVALSVLTAWVAWNLSTSLPHIQDRPPLNRAYLRSGMGGAVIAIDGFALYTLWRRVREFSVCDLWLSTIQMGITLGAVLNILSQSRYSYGFYVGKSIEPLMAIIFALVLLHERRFLPKNKEISVHEFGTNTIHSDEQLVKSHSQSAGRKRDHDNDSTGTY